MSELSKDERRVLALAKALGADVPVIAVKTEDAKAGHVTAWVMDTQGFVRNAWGFGRPAALMSLITSLQVEVLDQKKVKERQIANLSWEVTLLDASLVAEGLRTAPPADKEEGE